MRRINLFTVVAVAAIASAVACSPEDGNKQQPVGTSVSSNTTTSIPTSNTAPQCREEFGSQAGAEFQPCIRLMNDGVEIQVQVRDNSNHQNVSFWLEKVVGGQVVDGRLTGGHIDLNTKGQFHHCTKGMCNAFVHPSFGAGWYTAAASVNTGSSVTGDQAGSVYYTS